MDFLTQSSLDLFDLVLLALILVGWPLLGSRSQSALGPDIRPIDIYQSSIIVLWASAIPILIWWAVAGRPWGDLGLAMTFTVPMLATFAVAAIATAYFVVQLIRAQRSSRVRAKLRAEVAGMQHTARLVPRTAQDRRWATALSFTAGITEEVVFRGYLIWALSQMAPLWVAIAVSVALFAFLHRYQGWRGTLQVAAYGALLTGMFVMSGSLIPGILLHIITDILNISRMAVSAGETNDDVEGKPVEG